VRFFSVALGVNRRSTRKLLKNPAPALPSILLPLFMFAAFAGALSAIADLDGFDYYDYTAFVFVFALVDAAIVTGVFSSFQIASDYESGLGQRLMLATPQRLAIVFGYLLSTLIRFVLTMAVVWAVGLATGLSVRGDALDIAGLMALLLLLTLATTFYGFGIGLRMQSVAAGALVMIPTFVILFLTPLFVERDQLNGWLKTAAGLNPLTPVLEAGRGFVANDPTKVGLAFAVTGGLVVLFFLFTVRGMVSAEKGPKERARGRPGRGRRRQRTTEQPVVSS
jgi:ABC-2 type transport system permease protein